MTFGPCAVRPVTVVCVQMSAEPDGLSTSQLMIQMMMMMMQAKPSCTCRSHSTAPRFAHNAATGYVKSIAAMEVDDESEAWAWDDGALIQHNDPLDVPAGASESRVPLADRTEEILATYYAQIEVTRRGWPASCVLCVHVCHTSIHRLRCHTGGGGRSCGCSSKLYTYQARPEPSGRACSITAQTPICHR
jgi:hypothetical protein